MRLSFLLVGLACLAAGACTSTVRIGSASLSAKPSPHLDAHPYELIETQLHASPVYAECGAASARPGPAANLDTSLIPSDEYVQDGRRAQALIESYRFTVALTQGPQKGASLQVTVPAGFVSDFHSVPDAAVGITLPVRKALEAAVVHDWLYAVGRQGDAAQKKLADQAYLDILGYYGVKGFTHWAVASGVRVGGKKSFGAARELRFYNKCYYGQCAGEAEGLPGLRDSPAMALGPDEGLRDRLWELTVCIARPANAPEIAALAR